MTTITRSHRILVHAPLQLVFEYVSDLSRHPEWSDGELKIEEITPGPVTVGKEYRSRGEASIQKDRRNTVRVSQYEPPHVFGFVANDPDAGDVSHVFTFKEQDGDVLVERTMTLSLPAILAIAFRLIVYPLIGSPSMEKALAKLKEKLENR
jgi:uncharacterized protein YndB with AHSA1/START domain